MTTKGIAQAVGKEERTVRNWVKKLAEKSSVVAEKLSVSSPMKPADYDLDETVAIIEEGLGRNAAALYRENATRTTTSMTTPESIAAIVRETVTAMVPVLIAAIRGVVPESAPAALPAPATLSHRDQLRRAINQYATRIGGHREAWGNLYTEFYYRYHRNIRECAKNRGMDTLDYAEEEGLLPDLISLAIHLNGEAA